MISRRNFLGSMSAASLACMVRKTFGLPASVDPFRTPAAENAVDNTSRVKIAIGTGGHGHTYPAATLPFGAVQLGPTRGQGNGIIAPGITMRIARSLASVTPT